MQLQRRSKIQVTSFLFAKSFLLLNEVCEIFGLNGGLRRQSAPLTFLWMIYFFCTVVLHLQGPSGAYIGLIFHLSSVPTRSLSRGASYFFCYKLTKTTPKCG